MNLSLLDLTESEAKVYEHLARSGKQSAGQVSREAGVSYSKIYEVLASLERKGLVKTLPEKAKMFVASDPKKMIELIQEKKTALGKLEKEARSLERFYHVKGEEPVLLAKGKRNFYQLAHETPKATASKFTVRYMAEPKPRWLREEQTLLKKGADVKSLVRVGRETERNLKRWKKAHPHFRKLANDGVAMNIVDDKAVFLSLIKSNVSLLIKDKAFAKLMKKMFLATYQQAQKV